MTNEELALVNTLQEGRDMWMLEADRLKAEVGRLQGHIDGCQWTACDDGCRNLPPVRHCRAACPYCCSDFESEYEHEDDCPVLKRRLPDPILRRSVRVVK